MRPKTQLDIALEACRIKAREERKKMRLERWEMANKRGNLTNAEKQLGIRLRNSALIPDPIRIPVPTPRKNALLNGKTTYLGAICKNNPEHGGLRQTSTHHCVACKREQRKLNREYHKLYQRMRRKAHPRTSEQIKHDRERMVIWRQSQPQGYYKTKTFEEDRAVRRNTMIALREMGVRI